MVSRLRPTSENIFMRLFEKILLENCPVKFKPAVYRSSVDTFLFFRSTEHVGNF